MEAELGALGLSFKTKSKSELEVASGCVSKWWTCLKKSLQLNEYSFLCNGDKNLSVTRVVLISDFFV